MSSTSLLRLFSFPICLKCAHHCSLKYFYDGCFKSLSDDSNISVFSMLASIDCLFSIQFEIFPVLGIREFQLKPGHLGYYVRSLWILLKQFCFSWLPLTLFQQKKEREDWECQLPLGLYWYLPSWEGKECLLLIQMWSPLASWGLGVRSCYHPVGNESSGTLLSLLRHHPSEGFGGTSL